MSIFVSSLPRIEEHRVPVVFDCPHCHAERVHGTAYDLRETVRAGGHVPVWGWSSHWVRCSNCRTELHAKVASSVLAGEMPASVSKLVRRYLPFPQRVLAVSSVVMAWVPVVGVVLGLITVAATFRTRGWPRVVGVIGLTVATLFNAIGFTFLLVYAARMASPLPGM
jgi:hypothetical protein